MKLPFIFIRDRFKMEKVGQYLKRETLSDPSDVRRNPWLSHVKSSKALSDSTVLYPVMENKSLVQLQEHMESVLYTVLNVSSSLHFLFINRHGLEGDQRL